MKMNVMLTPLAAMEERGMKTSLIFATIVGLLLAGCEKARLDAQVKELCAKDGGIKVYETVKLPAERFDQWGMVRPYDPTQGENSLGSEYIFKRDTNYFKKGNPEMWSTHVQIVRRSDNKLLGESTRYSRRGGDLPGPWHESSLACPKDAGQEVLIQSVFMTTRGDKQ